MFVLHIEHPVPNFDGWKKAFASDPIDRKAAGVKKYKVYRASDQPDYVAIDLEFESLSRAEQTLQKLQALWGRVEGTVMNSPRARIFQVCEEALV